MPDLTWELVNKSYGDRFPNILFAFDLILTLPAHSADCERGFSHMKPVKKDWRSRLTDGHLSDIFAINLDSGSCTIETFDPKPAISLWLAAGPRSRRPDTAPRGSLKRESESDHEAESDFDLDTDKGELDEDELHLERLSQ